MDFKDFFIRNLEAKNLQENFFISAIISIFLIRIFLKITHYPQLGTGEFHIAHMLWGGFFMLLSILILTSFLSRTSASFASVLGGIGFGTFIDELGKFITADNDYFYQPSVALIYIVFILIYLILEIIPKVRTVTQKEYLTNTVEMLKEAAVNDFDIEEETHAAEFISHCDLKDPFVKEVAKLLTQIKTLPPPPPGIFTRFRIKLRNWYYTVARQGFILKLIIFYLAVQALYTIITFYNININHLHLQFYELGKIYSSLISALFIILGLFTLRLSNLEAYRFFRISILVSILLTQFFAFLSLDWLELIPLAINLSMLMIVNYALYMEKHKLHY